MVVAADAPILGRNTLAKDSPAAAVGHPTKLLVILMDERSRVTGHVADGRAGDPVGVAQTTEPGTPQDTVDRRGRVTGQRCQAKRTVTPADPGPNDRGSGLGGQSPRRSVRATAAVFEPGQPFGAVPADPLVSRRPADPELLGDRRRRPTVNDDPFHQQLAAEDTETRLRMCHESLRAMWVLNTSHRAARLSNVNNVFGHHS